MSSERAGWPTVPGYELHEVLGRGGFATVYRATQTSVSRSVALKVLASGALDANTERRFGHEVRAVGALSDHPHVVALIDAGTTAEGSPFISMQLVPDGSMGDRVRAEGPLPADEVARIGAEVADALEAAHDAGILHRDIKPDNILVGRRGRALLTDFGIATLDGGTMTATGTITGTIAYTPPEVITGSRPSPPTDVFALGATLYTLLAGRLAFSNAGDEHVATVIYRVTTEDPPPLPATVPAPLVDLVMACLTKDPAGRPPLVEVRERLEALAGAAPTGTVEVTASDLPSPPAPVIGSPPPRQATASVPAITEPPPVSPEPPTATGEAATEIAPVADRSPAPPSQDAATVVQGADGMVAGPPSGEDAATVVQPPDLAKAVADDEATVVQAPAAADAAPPPDGATVVQPGAGAAAPVAPPSGPPSPPPAPPSPAGPKTRSKVPIVAVGVVLVLIVAGVAGAVLLGGGDDDGDGPGPSAGSAENFAVGSNPIAILAIGNEIWAANRDDATVARLGVRGGGQDVVAVGQGPSFLAEGDGSLWVVNTDESTLSRVDPGSGEVLTTASVGSVPGSIAASDTGVWVVSSGDLDIARVDYGTDEYTDEYGPLPAGTSQVSAAGETAWVATAGDDGTNQVVRLDGAAAEQAIVPLDDAPSGIAATDDAVYVALAYTGQVAVIDPSSNEVTGTVDLGSTELGPAVVVDGQVWVADLAANRVVRLDGDQVAETVAVGARPASFTVTDGDVWTVVPEEGSVRRDPR